MAKHERPRKVREPRVNVRSEAPAHETLPLDAAPRAARDTGETYHTVKIVLFFLAVAIVAVTAWILPLRPTHSDIENRDLAAFPSFSWDALLSGDYFDQIGVWFSDTFPFREPLIEARGNVEQCFGIHDVKIYGPNENPGDDIPDVPTTTAPSGTPTLPSVPQTTTTASGATTTTTQTTTTTTGTPLPTRPSQAGSEITELSSVLVVGNSAYEYYNFSQAVADDYTAAINYAASLLKGKANVYDMIIPTGVDVVLSPDVKAKINCSDQKKAIDYMYSKLVGAYAIPIQDTLRAHNSEYLYFSTDHHWTALGAYYSYVQFMNMKGVTPHALDDYASVAFDGFLGSFYSETQDAGLRTNEDTVYAYYPIADATLYFEDANGNRTNWQVITNVSNWSSRYKYNTFIGGDNAYTRIDNPDLQDGSSIIVIKESFGNAFVPFLVDHYQTVHVIDYRYYEAMNLSQLVDATDAREVLFINNISATRNGYLVGYIGDLVSR